MKPAIAAPVVGSIRAILCSVTPLMVLNFPTMYSDLPSGAASTALMPASTTGRNVLSTLPVV